ncbi:MAG: hypothetical protein MRZ79_12360 [Bacteroidia bacterium]|nr:hypothetical protein [Bacteroidia bacterium]
MKKTVYILITQLLFLSLGFSLVHAQKSNSKFKDRHQVWLKLNPLKPNMHFGYGYTFDPRANQAFWESLIQSYRNGKISFYLDEDLTAKLHPHALRDFFTRSSPYLEERFDIADIPFPVNSPTDNNYRLSPEAKTREIEDTILLENLDVFDIKLGLRESWDLKSRDKLFYQELLLLQLDDWSAENNSSTLIYLDIQNEKLPLDLLLQRDVPGYLEASAEKVIYDRMFRASLINIRDAETGNWKYQSIRGFETSLAHTSEEEVEYILEEISYELYMIEITLDHHNRDKMTMNDVSFYLDLETTQMTPDDSLSFSPNQYKATKNFLSQMMDSIYFLGERGKIPVYHPFQPESEPPFSPERIQTEIKRMKKVFELDSNMLLTQYEGEFAPSSILTDKCTFFGKLVHESGKTSFIPEALGIVGNDPHGMAPDEGLWSVKIKDLDELGIKYNGKLISEWIQELDYFYYPVRINGKGMTTIKQALWLQDNLLNKEWNKINWVYFGRKFTTY